MVNWFPLILFILTLISGFVWCFIHLKSVLISTCKNDPNLLNQNEKKKLGKKTRYLGFLETLSSLFPVLFIVFIIRSFLYEPFQIPSASMMPTLLVGDFILVEKFAYGLRNPITQTSLISTWYPKRGDLSVFRYPKDPNFYYIKRVIGLPGDKVVYNVYDKTLTIYPFCEKKGICEKVFPIQYSKIEMSNFIQTFDKNEFESVFHQFLDNKNLNDGLRLEKRQERLGNVMHDVLLLKEAKIQDHLYYKQLGQPKATWVIPEGKYFMMGDNRDNSADSRYWGFVPEKNLVGKAVAIWMSFDKQEGHWPTGIRLKRIGLIH